MGRADRFKAASSVPRWLVADLLDRDAADRPSGGQLGPSLGESDAARPLRTSEHATGKDPRLPRVTTCCGRVASPGPAVLRACAARRHRGRRGNPRSGPRHADDRGAAHGRSAGPGGSSPDPRAARRRRRCGHDRGAPPRASRGSTMPVPCLPPGRAALTEPPRLRLAGRTLWGVRPRQRVRPWFLAAAHPAEAHASGRFDLSAPLGACHPATSSSAAVRVLDSSGRKGTA